MTNQTEQIRFSREERKLLMQAMTLIEHYGQKERPELRAKIETLTQQKPRSQ